MRTPHSALLTWFWAQSLPPNNTAAKFQPNGRAARWNILATEPRQPMHGLGQPLKTPRPSRALTFLEESKLQRAPHHVNIYWEIMENLAWLESLGQQLAGSLERARLMMRKWALSAPRQTEARDAAFFFKQWGAWGSDGIKRDKRANGKSFNGSIIQMAPKLTFGRV